MHEVAAGPPPRYDPGVPHANRRCLAAGSESRPVELPGPALRAAVLTVSDRGAAGRAHDTAGPAIAALLQEQLGAQVTWMGIVPDELATIRSQLLTLVAQGLELVVTTGGTGLGPRDVTPEATRAVIEREVPGLAEAMRTSSAVITRRAWLSRAVCGTRGQTLIVNLPGSERAARENLSAILDLLPHAVSMMRGAGHPDTDVGRGRDEGS